MQPNALNKNNSAVKRIMREARELADDDSTEYSAAPLEDDIFEWHCTLRGPAGTDFEGGLYHIRIKLPAEYPFRPPSIQLLTPNGRFELNANICISFTNYHEESWQPAWGVRTAIVGVQGMFPLTGRAAVGIGSVEYPSLERKRLAKLSRDWVCPRCQRSNLTCLPDPSPESKPVGEATVGDGARAATSEPDAVVPLATIAPEDVPLPATPNLPPAPAPAEPTLAPRRVSVQRAPTPAPPAAAVTRAVEARTPRVSSPRPPILLDTAICVLLVLVLALICRKLL